jgi:hypothetical protein
MNLKVGARPVLVVLALLVAGSQGVAAYQLKKADNTACTKDGSTCNVFCDNGQRAGSMNWNGSVWTDGVKWDSDMDRLARKIVAANGTACR